MTWLLVEDDPDIRMVVSMMMTIWGEKPLQLPDGNAAWAWLDSVESGNFTGELPELALMDIRMPGYTGDKIAARIRETAAIQDIPIILMTAFNLTTSEVNAIRERSKIDRLINKPLPDVEELRDLLYQVRDSRKVHTSVISVDNGKVTDVTAEHVDQLDPALRASAQIPVVREATPTTEQANPGTIKLDDPAEGRADTGTETGSNITVSTASTSQDNPGTVKGAEPAEGSPDAGDQATNTPHTDGVPAMTDNQTSADQPQADLGTEIQAKPVEERADGGNSGSSGNGSNGTPSTEQSNSGTVKADDPVEGRPDAGNGGSGSAEASGDQNNPGTVKGAEPAEGRPDAG